VVCATTRGATCARGAPGNGRGMEPPDAGTADTALRSRRPGRGGEGDAATGVRRRWAGVAVGVAHRHGAARRTPRAPPPAPAAAPRPAPDDGRPARRTRRRRSPVRGGCAGRLLDPHTAHPAGVSTHIRIRHVHRFKTAFGLGAVSIHSDSYYTTYILVAYK
jgi:hypothetical protein